MTFNPFIVPFEQLPETLPIFPLAGTIVMPGNELPLNIFEPRYLNMVSDALGSHRMIGMIQPDPHAAGETDLIQPAAPEGSRSIARRMTAASR